MPCYEEAMKLREIYTQRGKELIDMLQNWSLDQKIEESLKLIQKALANSNKPIISCSWGKDSVTLTHLVHKIDPSVPILYNDTGVDFPETKEYMDMMTKKYDLTVYIIKPELTFWDIVRKYGYPKESRSSKTGDPREPYCCKLLKYAPAMKFLKEYSADLNFVGLIGDEGWQRRSNYIIRGAYYYAKTQRLWKATPLIWWKTEDIWEYLKQNSIPIHPAYKKYGIERIGCVPCTGHKNWQLQLRKISPRLYEKIATDMGQPPLEIFEEVR